MTLLRYLAAFFAWFLGLPLTDQIVMVWGVCLLAWLIRYWSPLLPHYREYGREIWDLVRGEGQ